MIALAGPIAMSLPRLRTSPSGLKKPIFWTKTIIDCIIHAGWIFTSFIMELVVYPAIYEVWRWHFYVKKGQA